MAKTSYDKKFISSTAIEWHFNLTLAPWHGGFFESLIRTVKLLVKKQWKTYGLNYEQMQFVLIKAIARNYS